MWFDSEKQRRRRIEDGGHRLVAECESFVEGHYVDLLLQNGTQVPGWAWLNQLAHADPNELAEMATGSVKHRGASASDVYWQRAVSLLAREIFIAAAREGCAVEELQRSVLVPLPRSADNQDAPNGPPDPGRVVETVWAELGKFRSNSHPW